MPGVYTKSEHGETYGHVKPLIDQTYELIKAGDWGRVGQYVLPLALEKVPGTREGFEDFVYASGLNVLILIIKQTSEILRHHGTDTKRQMPSETVSPKTPSQIRDVELSLCVCIEELHRWEAVSVESWDGDMGARSALVYFLTQRHEYYVDINWLSGELTLFGDYLSCMLSYVECIATMECTGDLFRTTTRTALTIMHSTIEDFPPHRVTPQTLCRINKAYIEPLICGLKTYVHNTQDGEDKVENIGICTKIILGFCLLGVGHDVLDGFSQSRWRTTRCKLLFKDKRCPCQLCERDRKLQKIITDRKDIGVPEIGGKDHNKDETKYDIRDDIKDDISNISNKSSPICENGKNTALISCSDNIVIECIQYYIRCMVSSKSTETLTPHALIIWQENMGYITDIFTLIHMTYEKIYGISLIVKSDLVTNILMLIETERQYGARLRRRYPLKTTRCQPYGHRRSLEWDINTPKKDIIISKSQEGEKLIDNINKDEKSIGDDKENMRDNKIKDNDNISDDDEIMNADGGDKPMSPEMFEDDIRHGRRHDDPPDHVVRPSIHGGIQVWRLLGFVSTLMIRMGENVCESNYDIYMNIMNKCKPTAETFMHPLGQLLAERYTGQPGILLDLAEQPIDTVLQGAVIDTISHGDLIYISTYCQLVAFLAINHATPSTRPNTFPIVYKQRRLPTNEQVFLSANKTTQILHRAYERYFRRMDRSGEDRHVTPTGSGVDQDTTEAYSMDKISHLPVLELEWLGNLITVLALLQGSFCYLHTDPLRRRRVCHPPGDECVWIGEAIQVALNCYSDLAQKDHCTTLRALGHTSKQLTDAATAVAIRVNNVHSSSSSSHHHNNPTPPSLNESD